MLASSIPSSHNSIWMGCLTWLRCPCLLTWIQGQAAGFMGSTLARLRFNANASLLMLFRYPLSLYYPILESGVLLKPDNDPTATWAEQQNQVQIGGHEEKAVFEWQVPGSKYSINTGIIVIYR
jgi:hypothetical protein